VKRPAATTVPAETVPDWDDGMRAVARALPGVLDGLRASYRELEERAARVERELAEANRERGELEERLHAADKLSALGTMAAGIAHEIRNPLNAVRGFAELLADRARGGSGGIGERERRWARCIVEGVCEVDAIIDNLLSFGSPEKLRLEAIDGRELLEGAARLAARLEPAQDLALRGVRVRSGAPAFRGDRIKLRQAVRNLLENALEAQDGSRAPCVEAELALEGGELVFRVSDAGPGVPAELQRRVLDPFFTTHADGTGLGLALVSVIARLHGGSVQCSYQRSALGGALFVLRIPFQPADSPIERGPAAFPPIPRQ
jgi:signal transduction histidine kinase